MNKFQKNKTVEGDEDVAKNDDGAEMETECVENVEPVAVE